MRARPKSEGSALKERTESKMLQCTTLNKREIAAGLNIQCMALIIIKYNNKVSSGTEKKVFHFVLDKREGEKRDR